MSLEVLNPVRDRCQAKARYINRSIVARARFGIVFGGGTSVTVEVVGQLYLNDLSSEIARVLALADGR